MNRPSPNFNNVRDILLVSVAASSAHAAANPWPHTAVNGFSTPSGGGFWLTYADGTVTNFGNAALHGDASNLSLSGPVVGGAVNPTGTGYWLDASDGGIFTYGSAHFHGSTGAMPLNPPVFSMAPTKSGNGYWLVARDGGIFAFGDAPFYGSMGATRLNQPINGIGTSPTGHGYRMVAKDGGIFSFGDAPFYGSLPSIGDQVTDVIGTAPTPTNKGYWIAEADGQIHAFGDAHNLGSYAPSLCDIPTAIFSNPKAQGYRLVLQSGATVAFGHAPGGTGATGTPRQCATPPPPPNPAGTCGAPSNPYGYNFCGRGALVYSPPSNICSYFACIGNFSNGVGYMEECVDGMVSMSGGRQGACSFHGGEQQPVYGGP